MPPPRAIVNFLRNLFSRSDKAARAPAAVPPPAPAPPPPPEPAGTAAQPSSPPEDCATFPLKAITDLFPEQLKPCLRKQPSEHVSVCIPRALIQPQLAAGAVRITFAQLRAAAPEIFFLADAAPPDTKVLLPLESVLRQMMPSRRDNQRPPAIPTNIPSIFLKTGQGTAPGSPAHPGAKGWYSQRRPACEAEPEPKPEPPAPAAAQKPFVPLASERHRREQKAVATSPIRPMDPAGPTGPLPVAPAQIIARIRALEGVAGAFLASADGLAVAGDVPQANENILAAFAPTVFAQLAKYADMAHLGLTEAIEIHLSHGLTVHVRRTGRLYLGVLMPPGRPLPTQELIHICDSLQPRAT